MLSNRYFINVHTKDLIGLINKLKNDFEKLKSSQDDVTHYLRNVVNRINLKNYAMGDTNSRHISDEELYAVEQGIGFFLKKFTQDANIRIIEAQFYARQREVNKAFRLYKNALLDFPDNPWLLKRISDLSKLTGIKFKIEAPINNDVDTISKSEINENNISENYINDTYQLFCPTANSGMIFLSLFKRREDKKNDKNFSLFSTEPDQYFKL